MEDIIPHNFNLQFCGDIMTELFGEKELPKAKFCKVVRLIADKLQAAGKTDPQYILLVAIVGS